ncbi:uncharacterized protein LOC143214051 isoform X1 [Lasioglossum baleicum]|uniref:uncharacterized protein LOC143214051 isoform X1 n=1 Tax=Lasioglossum baleicum TaxID=434251 RepID=UPI003FCCCCB6
MHQLLGGVIPMIAHIVVLFYICWRILAAARVRRKIMAEMREVCSSVRQVRENIQYIGEHVAKAVEEIKQDVGEELRITDRLTAQSSKVASMLQRFSELETSVIEVKKKQATQNRSPIAYSRIRNREQAVRMNRNMENAMIETPGDVNEEIRRIIAVIENKRRECEERSEDAKDRVGSMTGNGAGLVREGARRNTLSKFSVCAPRDLVPDRPRTPTTPEVRLLGESVKPTGRA